MMMMTNGMKYPAIHLLPERRENHAPMSEPPAARAKTPHVFNHASILTL